MLDLGYTGIFFTILSAPHLLIKNTTPVLLLSLAMIGFSFISSCPLCNCSELRFSWPFVDNSQEEQKHHTVGFVKPSPRPSAYNVKGIYESEEK